MGVYKLRRVYMGILGVITHACWKGAVISMAAQALNIGAGAAALTSLPATLFPEAKKP